MPLSARIAVEYRVYNLMNRGNGRLSIFDEADKGAEKVTATESKTQATPE